MTKQDDAFLGRTGELAELRTGTFCAYAPDARAAIRWTVVD